MQIINADSYEYLKTLPDNSVDSCVTDSPYGFGKPPDMIELLNAWLTTGYMEVKGKGFMGASWDAFTPQPSLWKEVYRVLKPGGHLLSFFGTRTYDIGTLAIRLAGFEIRDCIQWIYGCLSEDTEILTEDGFMNYSEIITRKNIRILCYDKEKETFHYENPEKWSSYKIKDTCYRIQSDYTDQIVSKQHRCLVEREGVLLFEFADSLARERKASVPFLESVPNMHQNISSVFKRTNVKEQTLFKKMPVKINFNKTYRENTNRATQRKNEDTLFCLQENNIQKHQACKKSKKISLFKTMQWSIKRARMEETRIQRKGELEREIGTRLSEKNDRSNKSFVERRTYLFLQAREIRNLSHKICEMPNRIHGYGKNRWLCCRVSSNSSKKNWKMSHEKGVCASYKSQSRRQSHTKLNVICNKYRSQKIRTRIQYKTTLATITPFEYEGIVYCPTVSTGAFVARRNGKVFITGNSGFPKSTDVSKRIDKEAGAERKVVGKYQPPNGSKWNLKQSDNPDIDHIKPTFTSSGVRNLDITAPATYDAEKWDGFGTSIKPANEPIVIARKPLEKGLTVAQNVLKWGTGALNIEGCKIHSSDSEGSEYTVKRRKSGVEMARSGGNYRPEEGESYIGKTSDGRFPANIIHDGSEEVEKEFSKYIAPGQQQATTGLEEKKQKVYGKYAKVIATTPRVDDTTSPSRFFYCAKASTEERNFGVSGEGNIHSTIKPVALMRWLVRLCTPPQGVVLDPFCGSGTTGCACKQEGFDFIGIDQDEKYCEISRERIAAWDPENFAAMKSESPSQYNMFDNTEEKE